MHEKQVTPLVLQRERHVFVEIEKKTVCIVERPLWNPDLRFMPPTRRSDLVTRVVDGEVVILDRARRNIHRLNATASFIWSDCDGKSTASDIATHLAASFESTPDEVLGDVVEAIANLERLGLLAA